MISDEDGHIDVDKDYDEISQYDKIREQAADRLGFYPSVDEPDSANVPMFVGIQEGYAPYANEVDIVPFSSNRVDLERVLVPTSVMSQYIHPFGGKQYMVKFVYHNPRCINLPSQKNYAVNICNKIQTDQLY